MFRGSVTPDQYNQAWWDLKAKYQGVAPTSPRGEDFFRDLGLRQTTFSALATIIENPDITQTQLGHALSIERSGVVLIVDEMENADIITRNKVKTDRRSYALRATLKGSQVPGG